MAKTVKIKESGLYKYKINDKTNCTTYVFANETVAKNSAINFVLPTDDYYDDYKYCYKSGNDLYFVIMYTDGMYDYESALIKIKDYYKYSSESKKDLVTYYNNNLYDSAYNDSWTYFSKTATDSAGGGNIFGATVSTTYNLSNTNTGSTYVVDIGGKDKYKVNQIDPTGANMVYINDPFGNDKYQIADSRGINITEYAGNDKYAVKDCTVIQESSDFVINDYSGNDNYKFDNVETAYTNQDIDINDYSGNDVYNLKNTERISIYNYEYKTNVKGNDKYTIKDSDNAYISDYWGHDKYVMTKITTNLDIYDYNYQNDSYSISGVEKAYVSDYGGKDTYKISNSSNLTLQDMCADDKPVSDNDKYTVTNSSDIDILDSCGKDTYNISGSYNKKTKITTYVQNLAIYDTYNELVANPASDNDKYNLTYVKNTSGGTCIADDRGSNTYNIKNSEGIGIASTAKSGKDTYKITSSKDIYIADYGIKDEASDVYSVKLAKNGGVTIADDGGTKDKLTISNLNKKNIIFMSDYKKGSGLDKDNSLILFDKKTNGFVQINNTFKKDGNDYSTFGFGDGVIETVKAGSKKVNTKDVEMINLLNTARANVTGWLSVHSTYSSVVDVLQNGNEADINDIIACFENKGVG